MTDTFDQAEPSEVEAVEPDQIEDQVDDQVANDDDESEEGDNPTEDEEYEEVERNGKKYRIPKDLTPELLRQDDYTRKTQAVAEERRALEAERLAFKGVEKEIDDKAFELKSLDRRMTDLTSLSHEDWAQIRQMDVANGTDNYERLNRELLSLPRQKDALAAELKAKSDEAVNAQKAILSKRYDEGQAVLARDIPGWGPELGAKLVDFVEKGFGLTAQELGESLMDPRVIKVIHAAYKAQATAQKAQTVASAAKASAVKPITSVKGAVTPKQGLRDDMPADDWIKARERQLARKG